MLNFKDLIWTYYKKNILAITFDTSTEYKLSVIFTLKLVLF